MAIEIGSVIPSLGRALGAGIAQPIEQGLDLLAQKKLTQLQQQGQQVERQRYAQGLLPVLEKQYPGRGQEAANFLSNLGEKERLVALQGLDALFGNQAGAGEPGIPGAPAAGAKPGFSEAFKSPALKLREREVEAREKSAAFRETKPERTEVRLAAKSAKENLARLDRMQELSEKGKLDSPLYLDFLKKTGLDISALKSPDSQEFQKLEVDFLRDAKNIFGSRVTNYEMSTFLKAIPSLSQSKEGRARVIRNLKIMNQAALERSRVMRQIIKDNHDRPPYDLAEQVEEKAAPKVDALLNEFRAGPQKAALKVAKTFDELPPASQFKNRRVRRPDGVIVKSDGKNWNPYKGE